MKLVYRCDYCDQMGTEEEIKTHEEKCYWNCDRKSCRTCKHRDGMSLRQYKCLLEVEIPENHLIEFCDKYEWDEKERTKTVANIFGSFFGGI